MRIPHIINKNTLITYEPSPLSLNLIGEDERKVIAENLDWDNDQCPTLVDYCVQTISKNIETNPILNDLPCQDRVYLLELLSTSLPLELAIPLINDEYYWERRYKDKFGTLLFRIKPKDWTWKLLYIERHIQDLVEHAEPQYSDEDNMDDILQLCSPYVKTLIATQLKAWKPPLTWDKEEIPSEYPIQHINFQNIFEKLPLIEEFSLVFGMNDLGETFSFNKFKVSIADCQNLGKACLVLSSLRVLRINRSKLEDPHTQALMNGLLKNTTIQELDLSNCQIGDHGALCIAKVLQVHPNIRILKLTNNFIGGLGGEGIGFALMHDHCAPLETLDMRLNPLKHKGCMGIMRALVRVDRVSELSLAGCMFEEETPRRVADMLKANIWMKKLNVSNNWFDEAGGENVLRAMDINRTIEWIDLRETDITTEQLAKINRALLRNRTGEELLELYSSEGSDEGEGSQETVGSNIDERIYLETSYMSVDENPEEETVIYIPSESDEGVEENETVDRRSSSSESSESISL